MTRPDDSEIYELEQALGNLASNPRIPATYRDRLSGLHSAVGARRLAKGGQVLSERDLDRFELVMARLHIAVQAKKKDLELQLRQYDKREKRLAELLDAVEEKRKEREKAGSTKGTRSRSSRRESSGDPE
jgi:hypothetical protein